MAISFIDVAVSGTTGAVLSIAMTMPTFVANDVLIMFVSQNKAATLTDPGAPWVLADGPFAETAMTTKAYYLIAAGGETGPTITSSTTGGWTGTIASYRGVDNTTPLIDHNGQVEAGSAALHSAPAITNTDANAWGVFAACFRQVATPTSWAPGTGLTERADNDQGVAGTTNMTTCHDDTNGTVATGSVTYSATGSSSSAQAAMWAAFLKPAATSTPVTLTETGTGTDALSVAVTLTLAETGTGTDALIALQARPVADTGSLTDALSVAQAKALTETGTGTDALSVVAVVPLAEGGSGVGALTVSAAVPLTETGTGTESLAAGVPITLTGETGSLTDALTVTAKTIFLADTGTGTDAFAATGPPVIAVGAAIVASPIGLAILASAGIGVVTLTSSGAALATLDSSGAGLATVTGPGDGEAALASSGAGLATVQT